MPNREEMRSLAEDIVGSYADRVAGIAELRETVKLDLKGFQNSRTVMAKELRADLAKGEEGRLGEARALKQELVRGVAERKSAVSAQLKELDTAHATMSKELKADLAKSEKERLGEAQALKQELVRGVAERKSAVSVQLRELTNIQAGVRDEWQILSAIMREKREGPMLTVKTPVEEIAEEAAEVTPETADIHDRVFEYLANHPDGIRLVELEQEFGVARIKVARLLKNLMDENKVEKQELLYFAI